MQDSKVLTVRVSPELYKEIQKLKLEENRSINSILNSIITLGIKTRRALQSYCKF